jgi:hypothetical protein
MTTAQWQKAFGSDAEIRTVSTYTISGGTMTVVFSSPVTGDLQKNMPYIIKTTGNVTEFALKTTVSPAEAVAVIRDGGSQEIGRFIGTYVAETTIPDGCLFISGNKFYCSKGLSTSKAFRAYFHMNDLMTSGSAVMMAFEDGTTGISLTPDPSPRGEGNFKGEGSDYYTLDGRKVNGQSSMVNGQSKKGVYIVNGKKVIK